MYNNYSQCYFIVFTWFIILHISTTQQSSTHNTSGSDLSQRGGDVRTWYDEINSPLIQQDGNDKCLKLRFDVSQYAPEEIVVKTVDNKLLVSIFATFHFSKIN